MNMMSTLVTSHDGTGISSSMPTDLHVFLAYENLAAALRASEALAMLRRREPDGLAMQLSPWSFSALEDPQLCALAAPHAKRAHLIVVAACGAVPRLSAAIEAWLRTCLAQSHEGHLAVAALFHCRDVPDDANSPRLHLVQRIAYEAGCAFFAPGVTGEPAYFV